MRKWYIVQEVEADSIEQVDALAHELNDIVGVEQVLILDEDEYKKIKAIAGKEVSDA